MVKEGLELISTVLKSDRDFVSFTSSHIGYVATWKKILEGQSDWPTQSTKSESRVPGSERLAFLA